MGSVRAKNASSIILIKVLVRLSIFYIVEQLSFLTKTLESIVKHSKATKYRLIKKRLIDSRILFR